MELPETLTINIEQRHIDAVNESIDSGDHNWLTECPVAQVLKELFPGASLSCGGSTFDVDYDTYHGTEELEKAIGVFYGEEKPFPIGEYVLTLY